MCRMVIFMGSCTRCGESQTWEDLTQHLSCLEAKNNGTFGECEAGVFAEQHDFDQECDRCAEEDEGVGDIDDEEMTFAAYSTTTSKGKRGADSASTNDAGNDNGRKKQKT
ncbi:short-chain dehydrogenase/reductase family protein [Purpureocillium lavendulum]|uniref:Short-chain dehydrogenase/reductase family protein n=1 Tax=Purpureocillium lavendulum TaxID=1247861 RepID=A0AB34FQ43_9HYPO|nr:short-chain dehydrogenase/reductase family protein [Purpureocillium lavendulum]